MPEFVVLAEPKGKKLDIDAFTRGYMECAVWLAKKWKPGKEPEGVESGRWSLADIDAVTRHVMINDCKDFQEDNSDALVGCYKHQRYSDDRAGRDFFLSRNRHGAGFFDRLGEVGQELQEAAKVYGEWELSVEGKKLVGMGLTRNGEIITE